MKRYARARTGAVAALMMVILPVAFLLSAMVINLAYIQMTQTELHIATDLSTRAAGYHYNATGSEAIALSAANQMGQKNLVAGKPLQFSQADLEIGNATRNSIGERYSFQPSTTQTNAVKLYGRLTGSSQNAPLKMMLPSLIGKQAVDLEVFSTSTQVEFDISLVLDRSGSMAFGADEDSTVGLPANAPPGWDFGQAVPAQSRWHDLVAAVQVFLGELSASPQSEMVSLVTYSDSATEDLSLAFGHSGVLNEMQSHTNEFFGGATNIESGLLLGRHSFSAASARPFTNKIVILLTDGNHNVGGDPVTAATQIANDGMIVFTVTFSNDANQHLMQQVAEAGQGIHYHAEDGEELKDVFREIRKNLPLILIK